MKRADFFDYYIPAKNSEIEMDGFTFGIYEGLLLEAQEFFRREDRLDGTVYYRAFTMLYIDEKAFGSQMHNSTYKGKIDRVSYSMGLNQKTLYKYRLRFDAYAAVFLEERGYRVISSGEKRPMRIIENDL